MTDLPSVARNVRGDDEGTRAKIGLSEKTPTRPGVRFRIRRFKIGGASGELARHGVQDRTAHSQATRLAKIRKPVFACDCLWVRKLLSQILAKWL
jgi:hypothetical protein